MNYKKKAFTEKAEKSQYLEHFIISQPATSPGMLEGL
jgi:hypothetical protein